MISIVSDDSREQKTENNHPSDEVLSPGNPGRDGEQRIGNLCGIHEGRGDAHEKNGRMAFGDRDGGSNDDCGGATNECADGSSMGDCVARRCGRD